MVGLKKNFEVSKPNQNMLELRQVFKDLSLAIVLAPLVAILTSALDDQHADNLITSIFSTDNLTLFFWNTNRAGNLISIISWPIQNIETNLKVQVLIKVVCAVFTAVWIARRIAQIFGISKVILVTISMISSVVFLLKFPESGDSIVYGGASQSIAAISIATALAISGFTFDLQYQRSRAVIREVVVCLLWVSTGWLMILWLVRAPAFILIELAYRIKQKKIITLKRATQFILHQLAHVFVAFALIVVVISRSGENTSLIIRGLRYHTQNTWYIWNFLLVSLALIAVLLLLARKSLGIILALSSIWILLTTTAVTAIGHVRENQLSPRYFAMGFFLSILVSILAIFGIAYKRITSPLPIIKSRKSNVHTALLFVLFCISVVIFFATPVKYGHDVPDTSGFNKAGDTLPVADYIYLERDTEIEFVTGRFWDVWPTVYEWRNEGVEILGLVPPGEKQAKFNELLDGERHIGICLKSSAENCKQIIQEQALPGFAVNITVGTPITSSTKPAYRFHLVEIEVLFKK